MTHEYNNKHNPQQQQIQQNRPNTLTIPLKTGGESLFLGTPGSNPGPLTMFSNIYNDHFADGSFPSFSELLMGSATSTSSGLTLIPDNWGGDINTGGDDGSGFKQKRPGNLVLPVHVSPVFNISPGFSPSAFITSPTFLSPTLSPYGMSPQHTLAQLTAQAHAALSSNNHATEYNPQPPHNNIPSSAYQNPVFNSTQRQPQPDPPSAPQTDKRPPNFPVNVDKPADDGYNWRKYGQKQVKGSEYPRSYYRCTSTSCPVKKKVERSFDGCITEIIYKGQHSHEPPQGRKGSNKDVCLVDNNAHGSDGQFKWSGRDSDPSAQATCMMLHGPSDSEESGENYQNDDDDDDNDEPNAKRRNGGAGQSDGPFTHRTMTEPKIVVQTRSEVDLLDDGYRWRKYGQKVVKGNPNPRSYYKCTTEGCKVRKHVERASTDARAVITTYEGKHIHDVPAPRGSSINASTFEPQQLRLNNSVGHMDFGIKNQNPASLRLKQEQNLG